MIEDIKIIDTYTWEQSKDKAHQLIENIKLQANFFEVKVGIKPTIFISYDLFALLAATSRELIAHRIEKHLPAHTICGYDLEIIHQGSELFYIGYKVLF